MESRVIKVNPNARPQFPYFGLDGSSGNIWFVKGKSTRKGYVKVIFVSGNRDNFPMEYEGEIRQIFVTRISRMRLTFMIGDNI